MPPVALYMRQSLRYNPPPIPKKGLPMHPTLFARLTGGALRPLVPMAAAMAIAAFSGCGGSSTPKSGSCAPGQAGCACRTGNLCDPALVCGQDGKCGSASCPPGSFGCACLTGANCNDGTLSCASDNTCQPASCTAGENGCGCLSDGTCAQPADGTHLICHDRKCMKTSCSLGAEGCLCRADGSCNSGQCIKGLCVADDSARPPASPTCFTPCQSALTLSDGSYIPCGADKLMARCLDGKVCADGSCVAPGSAAPGCVSELDCADFQTCIQGKCYSNCSYDTDCSPGRKCYRHVCRATCTSGASTCPTGSACSTVDGSTGYCLPIRASDARPATPLAGTFALSSDSLTFSSSQLSGSFVLTNNAPIGLEFKVRKLDHTEFPAEGPQRITTSPLSWLAMGTDATARIPELTVFVEANGGTREVRFSDAANPDLLRWEGRVEVSNAKLGKRIVSLSYTTRADGRWSGKIHYFANFGEGGLATWMAKPDDAAALNLVRNAFIQRWGALRQGRLTYDEFQAAVTATVTGSWNWDSVKQICAGGEACYLYSKPPGYEVYTSSLMTYPIPTAGSELPFAVNLKTSDADSKILNGKIVSAASLHYAGDPAFSLTFAADPTACSPAVGSACFAPLKGIGAQIRVGGRYLTTAGDASCSKAASGTYGLTAIPWLIPGFEENIELDATTGLRYRHECRDKLLPFGAGIDTEPQNVSLAQSNPIPDGRSRARSLELVDGGLINQSTLFILFRERFLESFLGPSDTHGFSAYGFMTLTRSPAELDASAYAGNSQSDLRAQPTNVLGTTCSQDVVDRVLGANAAVSAANASHLASAVISGIKLDTTVTAPIDVNAPPADGVEQVHYLCHTTGLLDGGPLADSTQNVWLKCPEGSDVTFFTTRSKAITKDFVAKLACQQPALNCASQVPNCVGAGCATTGSYQKCDPGTCQATLDQWLANKSYGVRLNPVWACKNGAAYCDERADRVTGKVLDLRQNKSFYPQGAQQAVYVPLLTAIDNAFRYKTQFRNRSGTSLGFVPGICVPNSNAVPYCYDPAGIEEIRKRVDCSLSLYSTYHGQLDASTRSLVGDFLTRSFGYSQDNTVLPPAVYDGFEHLNAELLIMLGDDAYTNAFASRFDLAGSRVLSFQGSLFEPKGINLAGGAGNEMYNLYKAAQYYQMVLDRFYALSPSIWQSLNGADTSRNFVTKETVSTYFDRLIRASTQKARAWSEVAKRYQRFNRPDLGRRAIERAYSAAYLESVILSRMMLQVVNVSSPADRDYIASRVDLASLGYRASLLDMRDAYGAISDEPTYFGFAPDYVPFPVLDTTDANAFTKLLVKAKQSMATAAAKETAAFASSRAFDTDSAQLQAELIRIRANYENQLGDICGTFAGEDGLVHPATRTYAYLDARAKLMGDPCGFAGNGKLHDAMAQIDLIGTDLQSVSQRYDDVFAQIMIENERVNRQCQLNLQLADYRWCTQGKINTLKDAIAESHLEQSALDRMRQEASTVATLVKCSLGTSSDCPSAGIAEAAYLAFSVGADMMSMSLETDAANAESQINQLQQEQTRWETVHQCDVMRADSDATVKKLLLELKQIDLEARKGRLRLQLAYSDIQSLHNQATRLLAEQEEMQQQTINVEAAKNDPNVRIYKNDDVILADQTFNQALADAYQATKVFEYYTSQSYAKLVDLFLVRMVAHGDYNLETYLTGLENAYLDFQQQYGRPDTRVAIASLRDDIFSIPRIDPEGHALTQSERIVKLRQRLADPSYIDEHGYLRMPFSTGLAQLSPLTRDHKILAIEAEIVGSDVGDTVGRVYLDQRGTGTVVSVGGEKSYYRFPERMAVLNPFFNGVRVFGADIYRSDRMRDRPLLNTQWELVLNQKDEAVNQDINLQSLTDIRLYLYYTDFTAF